jgi:hypothetical protein
MLHKDRVWCLSVLADASELVENLPGCSHIAARAGPDRPLSNSCGAFARAPQVISSERRHLEPLSTLAPTRESNPV